MTLDARFRRRLPLAAGLVLVLVALGAAFGYGRAATTPLWSDQPIAVAPTTVSAPDWVALAQALKPAVVNVSMKRAAQATPEALDPFFQQFFGRVPPRVQRGLGSGFVINADGYVVTNNHVVDGATEIRVKLADGRELAGRVVGRDPRTDLALLKVDAHGLPTIPLGDSAALKVGEPVMAIGNPFGLEQTVTTGIVSATGRVIGEGPYDDFIQTDASLKPGDVIVEYDGRPVGRAGDLPRAVAETPVGRAVPVKVVRDGKPLTLTATVGRLEDAREAKAEPAPGEPALGVTARTLTPTVAQQLGLREQRGVLVVGVNDGSRAEAAGLKAGDVIAEVDHHAVASVEDLQQALRRHPAV